LTGTVRGSALVAILGIISLLLAAPAAGAAATVHRVTLPADARNWRLGDVAVGADGRGWAAGEYAGLRGLVVRESADGTWSRSYLARVSLGPTQLSAVTTTAQGGQAFAAGAFTSPELQDRALVVHWTGSRWERMSPLNRPGATDLYGIAARGPNDVWAVGSSSSDGFTTTRTVIEHWNGASWSLLRSPNPDEFQNELTHVAAGRDGSLFATGHTSTGTLVVHRVHGRWRAMDVPPAPPGFSTAYLEGLLVRSRSDVWLAGGGQRASDGGERPLLAHWNGVRWALHRLPTVDQSYLTDVVRLGGRPAAVGTTYTDFTSSGLVEEWSGDAWSASAADEATGLWAAEARAGRALAVGDAPRGGAVVEEILP
jgi:hypothetical protein